VSLHNDTESSSHKDRLSTCKSDSNTVYAMKLRNFESSLR